MHKRSRSGIDQFQRSNGSLSERYDMDRSVINILIVVILVLLVVFLVTRLV